MQITSRVSYRLYYLNMSYSIIREIGQAALGQTESDIIRIINKIENKNTNSGSQFASKRANFGIKMQDFLTVEFARAI